MHILLALAGTVLLLPAAPLDEQGLTDEGPGEAAMACASALARRDKDGWAELLAHSREPDHVRAAQFLFGRAAGEGPRIMVREGGQRNGVRATVPLSVAGNARGERADVVQMLFERDDDAWWFSGVEPRPQIAREWLFEHGKPGAEGSPELAMAAFLIAMGRHDIAGAERVCTFDCWEGPGENAVKIFETDQEKDISFTAERVETSGARSVAHMRVKVGEQPEEQFAFLLVRLESGWLIGGFGHDPKQCELFLAERSGPRPWPLGARELTESLVASVRERIPHRTRRLVDPGVAADGPFWAMDRAVGEGSLRMQAVEVADERDGRSLTRITLAASEEAEPESLWLHLGAGPDGWRVIGVSGEEAPAQAYYRGVETK